MPSMAQEVSQEAKKAEKKEAVKSHLKQHFKPYGFIRNYFTYDSRESMSGTADLYNYQPRERNGIRRPNRRNCPAYPVRT